LLIPFENPIVKVENDWFRDKEEQRKRKRVDKEAQRLEKEQILANIERSRQQAAAMLEYMQSQFIMNLNDLFNCSKLSSSTGSSRFVTLVPTMLGIPPVCFVAIEGEHQ
jgi:hypothetical protein